MKTILIFQLALITSSYAWVAHRPKTFGNRASTSVHTSAASTSHAASTTSRSLPTDTSWSSQPTTTTGPSPPSKPSTVPATFGTTFVIDGVNRYFTGTNAWWLGHLTSDADVKQAVSEIAASGLKTIRIWAFGNANSASDQTVYYQLLDTATKTISINHGTNGIARLDSAVKYAEQYGVQLILPMLNNWDDLGGINTYCNYFGCSATTFYADAGAQKAYKDYISFIVNRYKSSPAIFAWELCNEPRCRGCDASVITNWASDTSAYIKSLDSTHLVTLGDEGWFCNNGIGDGSYAYGCGEGVDFVANLQIATLDYGTLHLYPDSWGYNYTWGNTWIQEHAALASKHGKPVVLEEYGVSNALSNRTVQMKEWQATVLANDVASDSWWQFATNFADGFNPYDVYAIFYGTQEYQDIVIAHVAEMDTKKV